ncbi:hybrid sensor histidine kinase/response regulator [Scytonema hofmannii PCC 7110]|uniref:histidine kinase n=1 Tax=Scytonema hofmannii PCC 7110 TaxID=128403 RepID=A0A139WUW6_9CYAN|nr:response regulator [Scytonema hofmannii]KYC36231.1 hybrid sensor histidine kinase/response regulator [Scytonema hofmannii PCC 7110]
MSGLRFLLLEDSLLDTELIYAILKEGGVFCELVQVKTQAEFQKALEEDRFDLILSDYSLPGFDGILALEMVRRLVPNIPFIFVTATMGEEVAIETLKSGATDYVLKQRLERVVPSVKRAMREAEERRARQQAEAELKQQKEELERANRIKDEFLAVLSHELRSPLNAILGWSKILRTRQIDEVTLARALETIERNAKLQTQLIEDLLDVSRIIRGKLTLRAQPTNLIPAIEAAIDTMRLAAQAKSIDLKFSILDSEVENQDETSSIVPTNTQTINQEPKSPPLASTEETFTVTFIPQATQWHPQSKFFVLGDPNRLQQIVWNLLSNAIKFTTQGGQVEVLLERIGEEPQDWRRTNKEKPTQCPTYARITVKDTGIGIHSEFLPYVFDSFRQADGSITRKHGGLGLGLAIVRHLIELHGGSVAASSPGEGQGATFTVQLPILAGSGEWGVGNRGKFPHPLLPTPYSLLLTGVRVLVVDDEKDSRDFIVYALEDCGAIASAATSADSALEMLASFQPDVLVSDIGMPEIDGYDLIRQVRNLPSERGRQIPAIALTAYAGDRDRQEALAAGFQKHLSKPVMPDELANVVAELVKG